MADATRSAKIDSNVFGLKVTFKFLRTHQSKIKRIKQKNRKRKPLAKLGSEVGDNPFDSEG